MIQVGPFDCTFRDTWGIKMACNLSVSLQSMGYLGNEVHGRCFLLFRATLCVRGLLRVANAIVFLLLNSHCRRQVSFNFVISIHRGPGRLCFDC